MDARKLIELKEISAMICPVCGYHCLGNGGLGCIDKKGLLEKTEFAIEKPCCNTPSQDHCDQCQEVGTANPLNNG